MGTQCNHHIKLPGNGAQVGVQSIEQQRQWGRTRRIGNNQQDTLIGKVGLGNMVGKTIDELGVR